MSEILQGVFDLLSQLLDIGGEHPEVLIATLVLIAGAGITCVLFCVSVVIAIPFVIIRGLFGFFQWLYYLKHPNYAYYEEEEDYEEEEPFGRSSKKKRQADSPSDPSDDPVLPHWLNQKGGRLL